VDKAKAIGVLGGTFDPVHFGHLVAAENARTVFNLEKVLLVPAARPPHKEDHYITHKKHRMMMARLATEDNDYLEVSSLEIRRLGPSYTIDTLFELTALYPNREINYIMGVDALLLIHTWKDYDKLADLCSFIVVTRPGYSFREQNEVKNRLTPKIFGKLLQLEIPAVDISSQIIRKRVAERCSIKYLLPEKVENYIYFHDLYKQEVI